jgi:hypothetical protein
MTLGRKKFVWQCPVMKVLDRGEDKNNNTYKSAISNEKSKIIMFYSNQRDKYVSKFHELHVKII